MCPWRRTALQNNKKCVFLATIQHYTLRKSVLFYFNENKQNQNKEQKNGGNRSMRNLGRSFSTSTAPKVELAMPNLP